MELEDIKEGMYVIYTEMPHSNYANSLNKVIKHNGELIPQPLCVEWKGEYIHYTSIKDVVPVKDYFDSDCWLNADDFKEGQSPIAYMNRKMPLTELGCMD